MPGSRSGAESLEDDEPSPASAPGARHRGRQQYAEIEKAARSDAAWAYSTILDALGPEETVRLADYLLPSSGRDRPPRTDGEKFGRSLRRDLCARGWDVARSDIEHYIHYFALRVGGWAESGDGPGNYDFWPVPDPADDPQELRDREDDFERHQRQTV